MRVIEALERENIESRPVWKPMHLQPVFQGARVVGGAVCERLFANGLCLPSGAGLERDDVERICDVVVAALAKDVSIKSHTKAQRTRRVFGGTARFF